MKFVIALCVSVVFATPAMAVTYSRDIQPMVDFVKKQKDLNAHLLKMNDALMNRIMMLELEQQLDRKLIKKLMNVINGSKPLDDKK